jgi:hypothetical protein
MRMTKRRSSAKLLSEERAADHEKLRNKKLKLKHLRSLHGVV